MRRQADARELYWTGTGPLGEIDVRRDSTGVWHVTYAGITRSSRGSLIDALTEACSTSEDMAWVHELAATLRPAPTPADRRP